MKFDFNYICVCFITAVNCLPGYVVIVFAFK